LLSLSGVTLQDQETGIYYSAETASINMRTSMILLSNLKKIRIRTANKPWMDAEGRIIRIYPKLILSVFNNIVNELGGYIDDLENREISFSENQVAHELYKYYPYAGLMGRSLKIWCTKMGLHITQRYVRDAPKAKAVWESCICVPYDKYFIYMEAYARAKEEYTKRKNDPIVEGNHIPHPISKDKYEFGVKTSSIPQIAYIMDSPYHDAYVLTRPLGINTQHCRYRRIYEAEENIPILL